MIEPSKRDFTRRTALAMIGAVPIAAHAEPMHHRSPDHRNFRPDFSNPRDLVSTYVRVCGSLDGRMRTGFCVGQYYGVVDATVTYLFDVLAGAFYAYRPRGDGSFEQRYFEVAYMVDPHTGEPLDQFTNPYTGKTVTAPRTKLGPTNSLLTRDARIVSAQLSPGATQDSGLAAPVVVGNDVWMRAHSIVKFPKAPGFRGFTYDEFTVSHALLSDLADPATPNVPSTTITNIVTSWRPWLEMGDAPGQMMLTGGSGRMAHGLDGMPTDYVALGHKFYPEIFDDPAAFLMRGWQ